MHAVILTVLMKNRKLQNIYIIYNCLLFSLGETIVAFVLVSDGRYSVVIEIFLRSGVPFVSGPHVTPSSSSAGRCVSTPSSQLPSRHPTTVGLFITMQHCPRWFISALSLLVFFFSFFCAPRHPWFHCLWCTWYWVGALERDSTLLHHFLQFHRGRKRTLSHLSIPYHSAASSFSPSVCVCDVFSF